MQIKKLIPSLTEQWKAIYERERPNLAPNAITGEELAAYAEKKLRAEPMADEGFLAAIAADVKNNAFFAEKLHGEEPAPAAFRYRDGTVIGIDRISGWFLAENDDVRDELTYVKGLDEADLENVLRTVDWLRCKKILENTKKKGYIPLPTKPSVFRKRAAGPKKEEQ